MTNGYFVLRRMSRKMSGHFNNVQQCPRHWSFYVALPVNTYIAGTSYDSGQSINGCIRHF